MKGMQAFFKKATKDTKNIQHLKKRMPYFS